MVKTRGEKIVGLNFQHQKSWWFMLVMLDAPRTQTPHFRVSSILENMCSLLFFVAQQYFAQHFCCKKLEYLKPYLWVLESTTCVRTCLTLFSVWSVWYNSIKNNTYTNLRVFAMFLSPINRFHRALFFSKRTQDTRSGSMNATTDWVDDWAMPKWGHIRWLGLDECLSHP